MAETRNFRMGEDISLKALANEIEAFLRNRKKLEVENIVFKDGYIIQARQADTIKNIVGLGMATQVQLQPNKGGVNVNIGESKWLDKAGIWGLGMYFFPPLAFSAGYGIWQQGKLPEEVFKVITQFIENRGRSLYSTDQDDFEEVEIESQEIRCPRCGSMNDREKNFCSNCGEKLTIECPHCESQIAADSKHCPECGWDLRKTKICQNCQNPLEEDEKFCSKCGTQVV